MRANVLPQIFVNEKNCKNGSKHKKWGLNCVLKTFYWFSQILSNDTQLDNNFKLNRWFFKYIFKNYVLKDLLLRLMQI